MSVKLGRVLTVEDSGEYTQDMKIDFSNASEKETILGVSLFGLLHLLAETDLSVYGEHIDKLFEDATLRGEEALTKNNSKVVNYYDKNTSMYTM